MLTGICHNCHGECLNSVTCTLEEDFDEPDDLDVVNLAKIEPCSSIKANTDRYEQTAGPSPKKRSRVDCFVYIFSPVISAAFILFVYFIL